MDTKKKILPNSKNLFFSIVYNKQISINLNKKKVK